MIAPIRPLTTDWIGALHARLCSTKGEYGEHYESNGINRKWHVEDGCARMLSAWYAWNTAMVFGCLDGVLWVAVVGNYLFYLFLSTVFAGIR